MASAAAAAAAAAPADTMDSSRATPSPPSSPLSVLSKSPSPPSPLVFMDPSKRYPSPSSTAQSGSASPMKLSDAPDEIEVRTDGQPPAKRRRTQPPKPRTRTTEYLDLDDLDEKDEEQLDRLLTVLRKKKKIVVIAGAGISVSAGIPDFRSSTGLFSTLRGQNNHKGSGKHLFDASVYKHDSSTSSFHKMVRDLAHMTKNAKPTPFHHLLASLAQEGRLMRLYTQNVDCIDTSMPPLATTVPLNAKGPWPTSIQLHGGLEKMVCTKCGNLDPFDGSLFEGPEPPPCPKCEEADEVRTSFAGKRSHGVGRLRPRIVLYNEYNPDEEAIGNVTKADLRRVPDAVIVVGTSMKIPGLRRIAKEMCQLTRSRRDGFTAWINIDSEPQGAEFKDCWDLVVRARCDDVAELANIPRWDQQDIGDAWKVSGDPDKEERCKQDLGRERISILLDGKPPPELVAAAAALAIKKEEEEEEEKKTKEKEETPDAGEAKSKLVGHVQAGGILPTPSASPKLRTSLPDKPTKGRTTQTKLFFINQATKPAKPAAAAASASTSSSSANAKVTKPKKPRPSNKKENKMPKSNLSRTFKATKNISSADSKPADSKAPAKAVAAAAAATTAQVDPDSSGLSSPPEDLDNVPSILPSLRDLVRSVKVLPVQDTPRPSSSGWDSHDVSLPSTPIMAHRRNSSVDTISPNSKPRSMEKLID